MEPPEYGPANPGRRARLHSPRAGAVVRQPPPVPKYGSNRPNESTPNQNSSDRAPTVFANAGVGSLGPSLMIFGSTCVKYTRKLRPASTIKAILAQNAQFAKYVCGSPNMKPRPVIRLIANDTIATG